jgi:hypothetical protein
LARRGTSLRLPPRASGTPANAVPPFLEWASPPLFRRNHPKTRARTKGRCFSAASLATQSISSATPHTKEALSSRQRAAPWPDEGPLFDCHPAPAEPPQTPSRLFWSAAARRRFSVAPNPKSRALISNRPSEIDARTCHTPSAESWPFQNHVRGWTLWAKPRRTPNAIDGRESRRRSYSPREFRK